MRVFEFKPYVGEEEVKLVAEAIRSCKLTAYSGRFTREFERRLSEYLGIDYVLATSSGTAALHVALKSIGIGPGDEVLVPAYTFVATAASVVHSNAVPVFVDIDRETLCIDPKSVEASITDRTKAILVVHVGGNAADMDEIMRIANRYCLYVVEDCAQAFGTEYRGRKVGTIGHVGAFSFYATKNITTAEGGAVVTRDKSLYDRARLLINHGETRKYYSDVIGYNYRMSEVHAAIGVAQLSKINEIIRRKEAFIRALTDELSELVREEVVFLPKVRPYVRPVWSVYPILLNTEVLNVSRDKVLHSLRERGLLIAINAYHTPLYKMKAFQNLLGHGRGCPWLCSYYGNTVVHKELVNTEWVCSRVISLLVSSWFSENDAIDIAKIIKRTLREVRR